MLVNIIHQDTGQHLSTIELDFPRLTDEAVSVAQLANKAFEQSGLKAQGYTWRQVEKQNDKDADFMDTDFDDPIEDGAIYRVLVMQKGQNQKKPTDVEMLEDSGTGNEGTKKVVARQPSQSIFSCFGSNAGQVAMNPSILLQFDLDSIAPLHRMALGSNGEVGNLYDVKTDTIIGNHEFSKDSRLRDIGGAFKVKNMEKANCLIGNIDMESRFEQLCIDLQQKISVLAQLSEVSGYGLFFKPEDILAADFGSMTEETSGFTIFQLQLTKKVSLNLRDTRVATIVFDQAKTTGFDSATHILQSCTYGIAICVVVTYAAEQREKLNLDRIHKTIQKYVKDDYKTAADWNYLKSIQHSFKVQLFADKQILSDLFGNEEAQKSLKLTQLLEGIKTKSLKQFLTKDFVGHQLRYELLPIDQLVQPELLSTENKVTNCDPAELANNMVQIDTTMKELAKAADDYKRVKKQFNLFLEFEYCFTETEINGITEISNHLREKFRDLESNCRHFIKTIRTNHFRHEEHAKTLEEVETSHKEFYSVLEAMATAMNALDSKLMDGRKLKEIGVRYVGRQNTTLEDELQNAGNHCYVLFFEQQEHPFYQENIKLFAKLAEEKQKCIFVNTELAEKSDDIPDGIRIVKYGNGKPEYLDYYKEHLRKLNTCIIRLLHGKEHTQTSKPPAEETLIELQIPCPKFTSKNSCPADDCYWECDDCGQLVQYDRSMKLDENPTEANPASLGYFYCDCGRAPANHFGFRCKNAKFHEEKFSEYTFSALSTLLKQYCKRGDSVNVLLLSETGCGKSTWINSLANYMNFETLEDAAQDGPVHVIPAMFMKGTQRITVGDVDKAKRAGLSDTQQTTCHVFPYKGREFKIFDTPGVCDTDGIGKDELNFKNIMWFISSYQHLNGIVILMKPNSARLTIAFKYCINELLKHLHRDAAKNILFCFTNSSGTNYEEGDTIPALQDLLDEINKEHGVSIKLNEQTTYYVDNEAFRYLCELKNNIQPSERAKNRATESWEMTVPVIRRMLSYIQTLPPHDVAETVSLNEARRIIVTLAQPLARITQIIQTNINLAKTQQDKISKLDADSADLEKDLLTHQQRYVERNQLPHPRTVCTAPTCTTVSIDEFGQSTTVYSTHCHPHCYLQNVREETRADPGLKQCAAMTGNNQGGISCHVCNCFWDQHMHIYYELIDKTRTVENAAVKDMLKNNIDKKQIIECAMQEAEKLVQKNKEEQDRINEIAARFGTYLKRNGIVSHNKYIEDYMQMQIQNAQVEAQYTNDNTKIESLENALKNYLEQRQIIERYLDTGKETIHPSDIKKYLHELINLELNGALIKELFDAEEKSRKERAASAENPFVRQHKPRASRNPTFEHDRNDAKRSYWNSSQSGSGRNESSGSRFSVFSAEPQSPSYSGASSPPYQSSSSSTSFSRATKSRSSFKFGDYIIKKIFGDD